MHFKKIICLIAALVLILAVMTACGRGRIPENNGENGTVNDSSSGDLSDLPGDISSDAQDASDNISRGLNDFTDDISEGLSGITGDMTSNSNPTVENNSRSYDTGAANTTAPGVVESDNTASQRIILGENTGTSDTLTGYAKLPSVHFEVTDPENSRGLSLKKVSHSHGPASGGEAHYTVKEFQKHFDEYGALTLDTMSSEKRLYLTFDCGYEHNNLTSKILDTLKEKQVPAAFFCTLHHIKSQPELITRMIKEGHIVGNHSDTHPSFAEISRTQMAKEIENCDNFLREEYGYSAKFFRFPAGEYNDSALDLVSSIGFTSVFWSVAYSDWDVNNPHGKDYAVKTVMERLHPGAVILLHSVSQDNADALGEIIDKARSEGYEFYSLDSWKA